MSGPAPLPDPADDLALDPGLLAPGPTIEYGGYQAVERLGGTAVLRWRGPARDALARSLRVVPELPEAACAAQAVVRISRGQAATAADLAAACRNLIPGGELAVVGPNSLGIAAWVRRLEEACGAPLRVQARAKSRLAVFAITQPTRVRAPPLEETTWDGVAISAAPGLFNAGRLDAGTALLIEWLRSEAAVPSAAADAATMPPVPPRRIADLACGAGYLGLAAVRLHPAAGVEAYDADWQAVASTRATAHAHGLAARLTSHWWDAHEPLPRGVYDLILSNPPAHAGNRVDLAAATALVHAALPALAPGGRLLVVANQRLPYEREWARLASWRLALQRDGYKILETFAGR